MKNNINETISNSIKSNDNKNNILNNNNSSNITNIEKLSKEKFPLKELSSSNIEEDINIDLIKEGFKIVSLSIKDGDGGKVLWESKSYNLNNIETEEHLPKEILTCKEVIREVKFYSKEKIFDLELVHNYYLTGELIETDRFYFGFVIPNSTNNWEQIIEAKSPEEMIPFNVLSGNLVVEVLFLSKGELIVRNRVLIYYE